MTTKVRTGWLRCVLPFLFLVLLLVGAPAQAQEKHRLYLDLTFQENFLFDRYDLELYVDEERVMEIPYGKPFSALLEVSGGDHTLTFCKKGDPSVKGEGSVTLREDSTFRCRIKTEGKKVRLLDQEVTRSLEGSSLLVPDLSLILLPEGRDLLEKSGFQNIRPIDESKKAIRGPEEDWIILSQGVPAGKALDKNEEIVLTCQELSGFYQNLFEGLTPQEAVEKAAENGCEISFVDPVCQRDLRNTLSSLSARERDQWRVVEAVPVQSNKKLALLYVRRKGKAKVPSVLGMELSYATREMQLQGFDQIRAVDEKGEDILSEGGYRVEKQSPAGGGEAGTEEEILLVCHFLQKLKEETLFFFDQDTERLRRRRRPPAP